MSNYEPKKSVFEEPKGKEEGEDNDGETDYVCCGYLHVAVSSEEIVEGKIANMLPAVFCVR